MRAASVSQAARRNAAQVAKDMHVRLVYGVAAGSKKCAEARARAVPCHAGRVNRPRALGAAGFVRNGWLADGHERAPAALIS